MCYHNLIKIKTITRKITTLLHKHLEIKRQIKKKKYGLAEKAHVRAIPFITAINIVLTTLGCEDVKDLYRDS